MQCFDTIAKGYDTNRRITRAAAIADKIRSRVDLSKKATALEFGCGTGLTGLQLAGCFKSLLLVDSSVEMVKQVEQKITDANCSHVSALCFDILEGTPHNLRVDYVFSSLVLHHIMDTSRALRCFYDMLNSGGRLLVVDVDKENGSFHAKYPGFVGHNGFMHDELICLAADAGFINITAETFYHDVKEFDGKVNPYSLFILDAAKN